MHEVKVSAELTKAQRYQELLPQIKALIEGEEDLIANLANICSALKYSMDFFWVGFYLIKDEELVLGPFQGPVACTRIGLGKGVCGTAWQQKETIIVPDVNQFPGHIACSSESLSEIVLPLMYKGKVVAVLDVDSNQLNQFDETDQTFLQEILAWVQPQFSK